MTWTCSFVFQSKLPCSFGVMYGMGGTGLTNTIGKISHKSANQAWENYNPKWQRARAWTKVDTNSPICVGICPNSVFPYLNRTYVLWLIRFWQIKQSSVSRAIGSHPQGISQELNCNSHFLTCHICNYSHSMPYLGNFEIVVF